MLKLCINTGDKRLVLTEVPDSRKAEISEFFTQDWGATFYHAPITKEVLKAAIAFGAELSPVESIKIDLYLEMKSDDKGKESESTVAVQLKPVIGEKLNIDEELKASQALEFEIGDLVKSKEFEGIGKVVSSDPSKSTFSVAFFESPLKPEVRITEVLSGKLKFAKLFDEQLVYCIQSDHGIWTRARYGARHPDGSHLISFIGGQDVNVSLAEIYVPNLKEGEFPNPLDYLAARVTDSRYLNQLRIPFIKSYTEQRAACRSISSIPSSSVELEPHQLAIVRRILQDPIQRYLLADEVGLGKTIEAGLLIREHVLDRGVKARAIIICPEGLVDQWQKELSKKFHLETWMSEDWESISILFVCSFEEFIDLKCSNSDFTLIVVDEAHQISPLAWDEDQCLRSKYLKIADACIASESCLLLSGTPLLGNEKNYLSMLHCLSPEAFPITQAGIQHFSQLIANREMLGGIFSALTPDNDDEMLGEICEELLQEFSGDHTLKSLVDRLHALFGISDQNNPSREDAINKLRAHIGNNFQIFHRLLRNRRVDPNVLILFPGLGGLTKVEWENPETRRGLDDLLEEYRDLARMEPDLYPQFGDYLSWLDLYFESPSSVSRYVENLLSVAQSQPEVNLLRNIANACREEEIQKLSKLAKAVGSWLYEHADGKIVIFCGSTEVAEDVNDYLKTTPLLGIRLHNPSEPFEFNDEASARVLICDQRGEDGLNLHGKRRLAIHYGLPRSLARIEQRNGRLNRYAARIRGVRKVETLAFVPGYGGIFTDWAMLLDEVVGLFDNTVASLQFVLEEHFQKVWSEIELGDYKEIFKESANKLSGPNGQLQKEMNRLLNLDQLNSLEAEVQQANLFAREIVQQDETAKVNANQLLGWITKGLLFRQKKVEENIFTIQFNSRTRLDAKSFVRHCLEGIDLENSDYKNPKSHPMSFDRMAAISAGHIFPFRFGQPFVDTIWNFSIQDPRAISTAFLRIADKYQEPDLSLFFRLDWLVEAVDANQPRWQRRRGDDWLRPSVKTLWLDEYGNAIDQETMLVLLKPYSKKGNGYRDHNLREQSWGLIKEWGGEHKWKEVVQSLSAVSLNELNRIISSDLNSEPEGLVAAPNFQLVSVNAMFLASRSWLQELTSRLRGR